MGIIRLITRLIARWRLHRRPAEPIINDHRIMGRIAHPAPVERNGVLIDSYYGFFALEQPYYDKRSEKRIAGG